MSSRANQLLATTERIDHLLTDVKAVLDRLMQSAAAEAHSASVSVPAPENDSPSTIVQMLLEDPVQRSETNEFEDMLSTVQTAEPAFAAAAEVPEEPVISAAVEAEVASEAHHDVAHNDGRGVFALGMVSMTVLVLAALFGQHYAGVAIIGGANLLAWLVVAQKRRDARAIARVAH